MRESKLEKERMKRDEEKEKKGANRGEGEGKEKRGENRGWGGKQTEKMREA